MLPEHVKALRKWRDDEKNPKARLPQWDDQLSETFDRILQEAFQTGDPLSITFIENGKPRTVNGVITKLDQLNNTVIACEKNMVKHLIPISRIIQMEQL